MSNGGKQGVIPQRGEAVALLDELFREPASWPPSAVFLKYCAAVVFFGALVFDGMLLMFVPEQTTRALTALLVVVIAAVSWLLVSRGKPKAAVVALSAGGWCYITVVSIFFGGLSGTSVYMYPLTILLTGWLIGTRAAIVVAVLTVAVTFALMQAEL